MSRCRLIIGLLCCMVAGLPAASAELPTTWTRWQQRQPHMGTEFSITLYAPSKEVAEMAFARGFARIAELDARCTNYRSDSEISRLALAAPQVRPVDISNDLARLLQRAEEVSRATEGCFDVTIGPLTKLWRRARRDNQWPERSSWQQAREAVGFQYLELFSDPPRARLTKAKMAIDLGGIAKGFALDEAYCELRALGITRALLAGGGDIRAGDPPPDRAGWIVAIGGLDRDDPSRDWIEIAECGVSTSGDRHQSWVHEGERYSHVIDPRTGVGVRGWTSTTVIARDATASDAWSSAGSVLGIDRALDVYARHDRDVWAASMATEHAGRLRVRETPSFAGWRHLPTASDEAKP